MTTVTEEEGRERPPRRTAARTALVASGLVGVATAAAGAIPLLRSEPVPSDEGLLVLLVAGASVLVFTGFAIGHRRLAIAVPPVVGLALFLAAWFVAEPLHWRLSVEDFDAVADGERPACADASPCSVGWWSVEAVDADPRLPTFWVDLTRDGAGRCYAGHGLARPDAGQDPRSLHDYVERRDGGRGELDVNEWRDGWVELCFTT